MTKQTGDAIGVGIIIVVSSLAIATAYFWGFGSGVRYEHTEITKLMEKAVNNAYEIGVDKGLHAREINDIHHAK